MVKDILREIKKKWFQFVAILIITALGVGFFVGIQVTGYNMRMTADAYTKSSQLMDYFISSSLGVDEQMIQAMDESLEAQVFGVKNGDGFLHKEGFDYIVQAFGFDDNVAPDLTLIEGRLPEDENEFVMDQQLFDHFELELNEVYYFDKSDILKSQEITFVGTVQSSLFFNQDRGQSKLGSVNGFIYVNGLETKDDIYTGVRVIANEGIDVDQLKQEIDQSKAALVNDRYHRIVDPLIEELNDAQKKLDKSKINAELEFDRAWVNILDAELSIEDSKNEIINALLELDPETQGNYYIEYYEDSLKRFAELKEMTAAEFEKQAELIDLIQDPVEKEMASQYLVQEKVKFEESMNLVDEVHLTLENGIAEIKKGETELLNAKETFQKEKKEALKKFEDAQKDIDQGNADIQDLDTGSLYVLDRASVIIGYSDFYNDSQRIESIGKVFPLVFFGVAVLVTLSTITRMIDESRIEIGIYKALGYGKFRTTAKFTGFTFFSWLLGCGLGLALGFGFIPVLIYNAYRIMYLTPELVTGFIVSYAWLPVIFSFLASVGIAFIRSLKVSSEMTAALLMPPSPAKGQRIFLERFGFIWNQMSFLYKVSFRNLFRNKTRFLMTLVGIGGCCGLLITGFGIQYSINSIVEKQFDEVIQYDAVVAYEFGFDLENSSIGGLVYSNISNEQVTVGGKDVSIYAVDSLDDLSNLISMQNRQTKQEVSLSKDDVVITEKLAIMNNIQVGDMITFNEGDRSYDVEVTHIAENYVAHYIYMSKTKFKEVTGYSKNPSLVLLQYPEDNIDQFAQDLRNEDHVLSVNILSEMRVSYKDMMGSFDIVIVVIVIAAFALELIVLLNLISMNMSERYKELATLKVLGFYPKELSSYVLRENIVLSFLSLIMGVGFGVYLHRFVLLSAEIDMIMFNRTLKTSAVIGACILTFVLSLLINLFMSKKANQVNMAEALKAD